MSKTKHGALLSPTEARAQVLFDSELHSTHRATDQLFQAVLFCQWLAEIGLAFWFAPMTWEAETSYPHPHVWQAVFWGGAVISLPCLMAIQHPAQLYTRLIISVAQALSSALLIHLMDGRIEAHFHVFVSLALLAFYRDWKVLVLFSVVVGADHFIRGMWLPFSVYGTEISDPWRFLEHIAWVLIEDTLLVLFCHQSIAEMRLAANRQARFEFVKSSFESEVVHRTKSLRLNEERFELALRGSKIGIYDWDLRTNWVHVSAQVAEILEIDTAELCHKFDALASRLHPEDKDGILFAINDSVENNKSFQQEFRLRRESGDYVWVECRGECSMDAQGHVYRLAGGLKDITARKRVQAEIAARDAKQCNSQKLEAVGALAGGIAHEFNNLIQAIRGYTEIARAGLAADDQRFQDLEQVLVASDRAASLTRQLLGFSRNHTIERRNLRPEDVIADLTRMIRPFLGEQIQVVVEIAENLGTISADPVLVQQMFLNLCINARDAMPDGGHLKVAVDQVQISEKECERYSLKNAGAYVHFAIIDNGCGIDAEVQPRIFEPFFTTKEVGKGTGLGLSMVYGVVQQHEGAILVESETGFGTSFHIYFPICFDSTLVEHPTADCPPVRGVETILVAEDEAMVRTLVTRILSDAGYSVLIASDGVEAIETFIRHQQEISLVLLDAVMPRLSGHEVAERLRMIDPEIPIVFCTGYDPSNGQLQVESNQDTSFVQKPFEPNKLLQTVREKLDLQQVNVEVLI